ncbi:MAG: ABC transporter permease [Candidatus Marinimicrobia bacterium]|nr:ABC transporter permease [Candidatus Neomarinimicrobiota bacterium]
MIINYLKTAIRNILRHRGYSFINITGLAIGVMAFIMIMLYVRWELSYDHFHTKANQIYRVATRGAMAGNDFNMAVSPAPVGRAFVDEIPGAIASTRATNFGFPVIRYAEKVFSEERWFTVDSSFFDVFDVEFIAGDPKTALTQPMTVVLTRTTAERYFGDEDPMGKTLNSDKRRDYVVTGIIEDPPTNTHMHYDFLGSLMSYPGRANDQIWVNNNFYTYLLLDKNTPPEQVEAEFPDMVTKYAGPQIEQFMGVSWEKLGEQGAAYGFYLQPITDIHLNSHLEYEVEPNGNMLYIRIFSVIAIFILIIACINFMNLATARSANRSREVGVRKTLGSTKSQLIQQFLTEAIILTTISFVIAVILVQLVLPAYNNLVGLELRLGLFSDALVLPSLIILILLVGTISGSYPAFFLSSFNPVKVLKGSGQSGSRNSWLRSGLVIFQFTISITLFTGTMVVYNQLNYIQNKDLGYNKENVVIVEKTDDIGQQIQAFKQDLRQSPNIITVSNSTSLIGHNFGNSVHQVQGEPAENAMLLSMFFTDQFYTETYQIDLVEGRMFSVDRPADSMAAVINQAAAEHLQIGDPLGRYLVRGAGANGQTANFEIIGIVKDFHFMSMHEQIRPMVFYNFNSRGFGRYTAVRVTEHDIPGTLKYIEEIWKKYAVDQPFEYTFLDDDFDQLYAAEERTKQIATIFSILAIFIASLGLFGLASFIVEQRTKEIGIRKVLGASIQNIYLLLSTDILKLIMIATILSWPLSYYSMQRWLENFAYRIDFSHLTFLVAGLLAFIIALGTVTTQAAKAATSNPVDALKYE